MGPGFERCGIELEGDVRGCRANGSRQRTRRKPRRHVGKRERIAGRTACAPNGNRCRRRHSRNIARAGYKRGNASQIGAHPHDGINDNLVRRGARRGKRDDSLIRAGRNAAGTEHHIMCFHFSRMADPACRHDIQPRNTGAADGVRHRSRATVPDFHALRNHCSRQKRIFQYQGAVTGHSVRGCDGQVKRNQARCLRADRNIQHQRSIMFARRKIGGINGNRNV